MKYKVQPAPGRIAVRQLGHAELTEGGIYIPATVQEKPTQGIVMAVCPEYEQDGELFPPMYDIGDVVVFGKYTGTQLQVGRDHVIILRENDILCKLVEAHENEGTDDDPIGAAAPLARIKVNDRA
jgi:chaperonin GroES